MSQLPDLKIVEFQVQAGPAYQLWHYGPMSADVGVLVGVLHHSMTSATLSTSSDTTARLDVLATAEMELHWRLPGPFSAGLRFAPSLSNRKKREYDLHDQVLWVSEAARLETGAILGAVF
jgi:hypothetical protein